MANVDALYAAIPVEVDAEDMAIYIVITLEYTQLHLKNANMFHYNADSTDGEIVVPGTLKVIALNGLNASNE
jgi:hypothetical protein